MSLARTEITEALAQLNKGNTSKYESVIRFLQGLDFMDVENITSIRDAINLGILIYGLNPYENKQEERPFDFTIKFDSVEMEKKPGVWKFKYGDRYIERALRIPYYYTPRVLKEVAKVGVDEKFAVTDHFLVGYEGGTGY